MLKETKEFRTKTILKRKENIKVDGYWPIALDVGYSAVKGISPNQIYCFPSYIKKIEDMDSAPEGSRKYDIQYKNEKGEVWCVGYLAQDLVSQRDTNDSSKVLYDVERYSSDLFVILTRVGLAFGLMDNEFEVRKEEEDIIVQAGLPPKHKLTESKTVIKTISGHHVFDLKVAGGEWQHFDFTIEEKNVLVMAQPLGALWNLACNDNGEFVNEAKEYFNSNVFVFDPGFGTLDLFALSKRSLQQCETFSNLGMNRVLKEVIKDIQKNYGIEINIIKMQDVLEEGHIVVTDKEAMGQEIIDIKELLNEKNELVCMEALKAAKEAFDYFSGYKYFIIDGGTGAAWENYIREHLKNMKALNVVMANKNASGFLNIFSNVRGYYMYLHRALRSRKR